MDEIVNMESRDYDVFATSCVEELKVLQETFLNGYDVNGYPNWFYNDSTRLLSFSTGDEQINFKYFSVGSFLPVTVPGNGPGTIKQQGTLLNKRWICSAVW
jgi:hypothetical protein